MQRNDPTVKIGTIDEDGNFVSNGNYSPKAYERLTEAGGSDIHFSLFDDVHDTTGLYKRADGTPYQYNGHWSWLYTLNNECKENIDGEEVTIWQWISTKSKTNRGLEKVIAKVNALNAEDYTADSWAGSTECTGSSQSSSSRSECNTHTDQRSNGRAGSSILQIRVWRTETSSGSCSRRSRKDPGTSGKL